MARMLLVDDHPAVQRGLRELLLTEFPQSEFEFASSEESALRAVSSGHWDLGIVDINLPGKGGLELLKCLKEKRPLLRLLIYTMHPEQQFGIRALRSGADGYLTKDSPPDQLFLAIRQLLAGRRYVSPYLVDQLAAVVSGEDNGQKHLALSPREHEVLRATAAGLSLSETAAKLNVNTKTVSTYRARIFEKLEVKSQAELIRYALRHGLIEE